MDEIALRYAHSEGQTTVCYDDSGRYLITCGCDGDIRVWEGFEDEDPKSHHMGETVNSLAFKNGSLYLSTDDNAVMVYNFPDIECNGVIAQFFTDVYSIACSTSGKYVVAGGVDFILKVYRTETKDLSTYRGHDAPILSAAIDPEDKYLASSSCDGSVKIWTMEDQNCIETLRLFKKSNDLCNSETLCHIDWYPKGGKFLAVPVQNELRVYERDSWSGKTTFKDETITEIFSIAAFSPCGSYIAGAANNGTIIVWDFKRNASIFKKEQARNLKICSLAWNPSSKKELAFCDVEGQLGVYSKILSDEPANKVKPNLQINVADKNERVDSKPKNTLGADLLDINDGTDFFDDFNAESMDGSENAFDIGAIKAKLEPVIFGAGNEDDDDVVSTTSAQVEAKPKLPEIPVTPLQTSFQPSSTPLHLDQRFMLWNTTGIVRCYNTEEENSVDVEFHDASVYHPIHVNNIHGFTMASLSAEALLLACPKTDDAPSKLQCLHIGTWDTNKEWTIDLPEDEEIEAITLGTGWAAAATSTRLLRLFTVSGIQCEVFCIPGPVVCLAGQDKQLAVSFHKGAGIPGEQNFGLLLVKVDLKCGSICKEYSLPVSSKAYLTWLGFTDEGHLCSVDTSGMVRLLNTSHISKWSPVSNMKAHAKGKSDNYFVVGLSEIQQEIRCIPCKGSRYPAVLPRPAVSVLPFSLPFCETSTDKGRLEEEQSRCVMTHNRIKSLIQGGFDLDSELATIEKKWTDNLLKMFALALRTDREYRALDVAEFMPNPKVVEGAIRYATQRHRMAVAERLGEIMYKKMVEGSPDANGTKEEDDDAYMMEDIPSSVPLRNAYTEKDEDKIQPKPLCGRRSSIQAASSSSDYNSLESEGVNGVIDDASDISLLPKANQTINPFKVQSKTKSEISVENKSANGGIDDMLFKTTKRLSTKGAANTAQGETKKQGSKQTKLSLGSKKTAKTTESASRDTVDTNGEGGDLTNVKPKKIGFALYLDECREELKKLHPDAEDQEIVKIAMKMFKELPPVEKEKYKNTKKPKEAAKESEVVKRKSNSQENSESPEGQSKKSKKMEVPEDGSFRTKFSMFAFAKKNAE